jgi:hypothetical protein
MQDALRAIRAVLADLGGRASADVDRYVGGRERYSAKRVHAIERQLSDATARAASAEAAWGDCARHLDACNEQVMDEPALVQCEADVAWLRVVLGMIAVGAALATLAAAYAAARWAIRRAADALGLGLEAPPPPAPEQRAADGTPDCWICFIPLDSNTKDRRPAILRPCNHAGVCMKCARWSATRRPPKCPKCFKAIDGFERIFM